MTTKQLQQVDPDRLARMDSLTERYVALGLAWNDGKKPYGRKPMSVNGVPYESARDAANATGHCESTLREAAHGRRQIKGLKVAYL